MEHAVKVSVVMPVYNEEHYIAECLDSIAGQTLREIEIICVDDGSSDASLRMLEQYAEKDSRMRILRQENQGAGAARNYGMSVAEGKYIIFLDSDDVYETTMLETMFHEAEQQQSEVVVCRADLFDSSTGEKRPCFWSLRDNLLPCRKPFAATEIVRDFFRAFVWWPWDKLYLRSYVQSLGIRFQDLRTTNDLFFTASAMLKANCITYVDNILAHHRVNIGTSLSVTREKSWDCYFKALLALRTFMQEQGLYDEREQDFVNYCVHFSLWHVTSLHEDSRAKLARFLHAEGCKELGISQRPRHYFYDPKEYDKLANLLETYGSPADGHQHVDDEKNTRKADGNKQGTSIKVSIVMPSLNVRPYIEECLTSVVGQTLQEIEIICVDAGSTDGTLDVLEDFASRDARIRLIHTDQKSYGHQMNIGIECASGAYIGIVETDDHVPPEMYAELYQTAIENDADLVKADFYRFTQEAGKTNLEWMHLTEKTGYYRRVIDVSKERYCFTFLKNNWSGIYRRSFLEEHGIRHNETPGASFQDNGFWFQTLMHAKRAYFVDKPYYRYRHDNPNSSVADNSKVFCVCTEYDLLGKTLERTPEIFEDFKYEYAFAAFRSYRWTLDRILMRDKPLFYDRLVQLCKDFRERGMLDYGVFAKRSTWATIDLYAIEHDSDRFFNRMFRQKQEILSSLADSRHILIYGAGLVGRSCHREIANEGLGDRILGFAVTHVEADAPVVQGAPVREIVQWAEYRNTATVIVAVKPEYKNDVNETLVRQGFRHIVPWPDVSYIRHSEFALPHNRWKGSLRQEIVFPFHAVKPGSRILLCRAQPVGQSYFRQLRETGYAEVVQWVDDEPSDLGTGSMPGIESFDQIGKKEFDYAVIATDKAEKAKKIAWKLICQGIPLERIVWENDGAVPTWQEAYQQRIFKPIETEINARLEAQRAKAESVLKGIIRRKKVVLQHLAVLMPDSKEAMATLSDLDRLLRLVDCILRVKLAAHDIFACETLMDVLDSACRDERILQIGLATQGDSVPSDAICRTLRDRKIPVELFHGKTDLLHALPLGKLQAFGIQHQARFADIRLETLARVGQQKMILAMHGGRIYRCNEEDLWNALAFNAWNTILPNAALTEFSSSEDMVAFLMSS